MLSVFTFNNIWEDIKPYTGDYDEYITIHGTAQKEQIQTLQNEMSLIPKWILDKYKSDGGKVNLSSKSMEEIKTQLYGIIEEPKKDSLFFTQVTAGFFCLKNKEIWIFSDKDFIEETTLHEFGHYLDYSHGIFSDTEEFKRCYELEKKQFLKVDRKRYHTSIEREYFAACFEKYIKKNKLLETHCPKTYELMKNLIDGGI